MLNKFLSPQNDAAFKKIFGTEKNKKILIHFLNDVLGFKEGEHIRDVFFLNPTLDRTIAAQKTSLVDVLCKDEKGNKYIVEMQIIKQKGFEKRAQFYASRVYGSQMNEGDEYDNLKDVIFLAITNAPIFNNKDKCKSKHITLDEETHEHDLKGMTYVFLDLSKFNKSIDDLTNVYEKWCYFLKHARETTDEDLKKIVGKDRIIGKAYEVLNRYSWNEAELNTYEDALDQERVFRAQLAAGKEEGFVEGERKGKAEGLVEGAKKGKIDVAKKFLSLEVDMNVIENATGLTKQEIESYL